jgi:hypothetical protein
MEFSIVRYCNSDSVANDSTQLEHVTDRSHQQSASDTTSFVSFGIEEDEIRIKQADLVECRNESYGWHFQFLTIIGLS